MKKQHSAKTFMNLDDMELEGHAGPDQSSPSPDVDELVKIFEKPLERYESKKPHLIAQEYGYTTYLERVRAVKSNISNTELQRVIESIPATSSFPDQQKTGLFLSALINAAEEETLIIDLTDTKYSIRNFGYRTEGKVIGIKGGASIMGSMAGDAKNSSFISDTFENGTIFSVSDSLFVAIKFDCGLHHSRNSLLLGNEFKGHVYTETSESIAIGNFFNGFEGNQSDKSLIIGDTIEKVFLKDRGPDYIAHKIGNRGFNAAEPFICSEESCVLIVDGKMKPYKIEALQELREYRDSVLNHPFMQNLDGDIVDYFVPRAHEVRTWMKETKEWFDNWRDKKWN